MPLTLYCFRRSPPCRAVLLAARAIGVRLVEKTVDLKKAEHKTEAFLKMNPTHTVPTLDDDGFYVWESRAIMGYLVQQYGRDDLLYPNDPKKRALVDNMLYFDADCLSSALFQFAAPIRFLGKAPNPLTRALVVERLGFLDKLLSERTFAAGQQLTIADLSLVTSVDMVRAENFRLDDFRHLRAWLQRVKSELPYYDEVTQERDEKPEA